MPENLKKAPDSLDFSGVEIPDPHCPVYTTWKLLSNKQQLPKKPAPQGWLSAVRPIYRSEALRRVRAFQKKMTNWLAGKSERSKTVVIPGLWLAHWVFEASHDFHSEPGWAVPIGVSTPSSTHLNLPFYEGFGEGYPDQELISFLVLGVRYKADLPVQIVLQPHLNSFLPLQEKYLEEAERFVERGWTFVCVDIPLVPYFSASCGSVCRPLKPDRPRCTWDDDGIRVVPLNEAISGSDWPKEVKPDVTTVMIAMRILKEAADLLGTVVFIITDDYKSFFNQLRLARSEYCKTGSIHPPRKCESSVSMAYDTVLGFGIKMASNIAQWFADFLVHIFRVTIAPIMDQLAAKWMSESSHFGDWWRKRSAMGEMQALLCVIFMYCDDPCILCVGPEMAHGALKVWTWMATSGGTMMAIQEKRSSGLSAKWIGVKFFTGLGVATATAQKIIRATMQINKAIDSSLNIDQYRSLIGFLEHVRQTLFLRGDKMYGLYNALSMGLEPIEMVSCNELMQTQLMKFRHRLSVQSGSSVSQLPVFLSGQPLNKVSHSLACKRYAIFSDAAKEGTKKPGLGGWICGFCWRVPLTKEHLLLDIPVLEAIAAVANVICASALFGGTDHLPPDSCFEMHVDALATVAILIRGRARSPMSSAPVRYQADSLFEDRGEGKGSATDTVRPIQTAAVHNIRSGRIGSTLSGSCTSFNK